SSPRWSTPYTLFSFDLLISRPPPAPLFPYTTLFRSVRDAARGDTRDQPEAEHQRQHLGAARRAVTEIGAVGDDVHLRHRHRDATDRKSTRLNSSHVATSYAVFCLKKKTRRPTPPAPS